MNAKLWECILERVTERSSYYQEGTCQNAADRLMPAMYWNVFHNKLSFLRSVIIEHLMPCMYKY